MKPSIKFIGLVLSSLLLQNCTPTNIAQQSTKEIKGEETAKPPLKATKIECLLGTHKAPKIPLPGGETPPVPFKVAYQTIDEQCPSPNPNLGSRQWIYPKLIGPPSSALSLINHSIIQVASSCDEPGGDEYFTAKKSYQDKNWISFKHNHGLTCLGMAIFQTYEGGMTFALQSGKQVSLAQYLGSQTKARQLKERAVKAVQQDLARKKKQDPKFNDCNPPELPVSQDYPQYYLSEQGIVLLGFFASHWEDFCEVEVLVDKASKKLSIRESFLALE